MLDDGYEPPEPPGWQQSQRQGMRPFVRIGLAFVILIAVLVVIGGTIWGTDLVLAVSVPHFRVMPPAAQFPAPADQATANRQDLDYLAHFAELDRSLTDADKAKFEAERQALAARAGSLSKAELELGVAHAVANAHNLNSNAFRFDPPADLNRLPIEFGWFAQGLFVVAAAPQGQDLLGARVLTIDGKTPEELAAAYRPYRGGGTDAAARTAAIWFLASPEALHSVWAQADAKREALHVTKSDGTQADVTVDALTPADMAKVADWHRLSAGQAPLSLQESSRHVLFSVIEGGFGFYLRIKSLEGDGHGPVARQLDAAMKQLPLGAPRWAVIDLRWESRGDYLSVASQIRELPSHVAPDGRIYVLTGPQTSAAGIALTAWLKHYAGGRAVIEGETIGDHAQYWSEAGAPLVLPNSKIPVHFSTGYHDWSNGCRAWRCYWPDVVLGVAAGDLKAAVVVPWRFEDYRDGADTILNRLSDITRAKELAQHN